MSEEFEEVNLFDDNNDEPKDNIKAVVEEDPKVKEEPSFTIPEKFQGKSFEDVIDAYSNLEKEMGRKANEVGELRKLTDEILKQQVATHNTAPEHNEVVFDDFIMNPKDAVNRVLETDPRLRRIEEAIARDSNEKAQIKLRQKHADADSVVSSPEFSQWVSSSPARSRMFQEAHLNYDADLASELLDVYKTTHQMNINDAKAIRDSKASDDLKKAVSEKGSSNSPSKVVYKRSDLIRLKIEDPNRYASMADEIRKAYAEKRVK